MAPFEAKNKKHKNKSKMIKKKCQNDTISRRLFSIIEGKREKSKPCFLVGPLFFISEKLWNMSKKLQTKAICPKRPLEFSDFAERKFQRARFLKKETTNPLFEKAKKLILET